MVCDQNETDLNIKLAAVMLPKDAGVNLEKLLKQGHSGYIYIPLSFTVLYFYLCSKANGTQKIVIKKESTRENLYNIDTCY